MNATTFDQKRFAVLADCLAVALAASLPWSTSATAVIAGLWLLACIPTFDVQLFRRVIFIPAGAIPVLFVVLGGLGLLWADVSWAERFDGIGSFIKFLFIPLLLYSFYRSDRGRHVLIGFVGSCVVLLVVSWSLWLWPGLPWFTAVKSPGIPVKDYISQSAMFTVCALVILRFAFDMWQTNRRELAALLAILALAFLANVFYVATSRTYLVAIPVLLIVFGYQVFGWKGAVSLVVGSLVLAMAAWPSASSLRLRVSSFFDEIRVYQPTAVATSAGERLEYWRKSVGFIQKAPLFGHGTGSIRDQFRHSVAGQSGMAAEVAANPHNQILATGIQLGLVGIALLLAMWIAHLALFRFDSLAAWVGLVVVVQNIVGSLFNSHLFDFTHGWAYVVGVGVAGGVVLRESGVSFEEPVMSGVAGDNGMDDQGEQLAVRKVAVEHHHAEAKRFVDWYDDMAKSRFANAFAYGRHKVDVLLDETLKELPTGAHILDVGCGTGEYVCRANELGFTASGLEPADAMRAAAISKNPYATIVSGVATELPFPDESFDLVICIEVLRYLDRSDIRQALREIRRVLRPGGTMFLTMVNRYALDGFFLHYSVQRMFKPRSAERPHCEFVTPVELDGEIRAAGFSAGKCRGVLFGPMRTLYKVSTGVARLIAPILEPIDDAICTMSWTTPFAGHLVSIAKR